MDPAGGEDREGGALTPLEAVAISLTRASTPPSPAFFLVNVKCLDEGVIRVKLLPDADVRDAAQPGADLAELLTVRDLKQELYRLTSLPEDRQRILWRGRVLLDADTLKSQHIEAGMTVHLVARSSDPGIASPNYAALASPQASPVRPGGRNTADSAAPVPSPGRSALGQFRLDAAGSPAAARAAAAGSAVAPGRDTSPLPGAPGRPQGRASDVADALHSALLSPPSVSSFGVSAVDAAAVQDGRGTVLGPGAAAIARPGDALRGPRSEPGSEGSSSPHARAAASGVRALGALSDWSATARAYLGASSGTSASEAGAAGGIVSTLPALEAIVQTLHTLRTVSTAMGWGAGAGQEGAAHLAGPAVEVIDRLPVVGYTPLSAPLGVDVGGADSEGGVGGRGGAPRPSTPPPPGGRRRSSSLSHKADDERAVTPAPLSLPLHGTLDAASGVVRLSVASGGEGGSARVHTSPPSSRPFLSSTALSTSAAVEGSHFTLTDTTLGDGSSSLPSSARTRRYFAVGQWVDVLDTVEQWLEATVSRVRGEYVHVHYNGWPSRWDEWLHGNSPRIAPFRTRSQHATLHLGACPWPVNVIPEAPLVGLPQRLLGAPPGAGEGERESSTTVAPSPGKVGGGGGQRQRGRNQERQRRGRAALQPVFSGVAPPLPSAVDTLATQGSVTCSVSGEVSVEVHLREDDPRPALLHAVDAVQLTLGMLTRLTGLAGEQARREARRTALLSGVSSLSVYGPLPGSEVVVEEQEEEGTADSGADTESGGSEHGASAVLGPWLGRAGSGTAPGPRRSVDSKVRRTTSPVPSRSGEGCAGDATSPVRHAAAASSLPAGAVSPSRAASASATGVSPSGAYGGYRKYAGVGGGGGGASTRLLSPLVSAPLGDPTTSPLSAAGSGSLEDIPPMYARGVGSEGKARTDSPGQAGLQGEEGGGKRAGLHGTTALVGTGMPVNFTDDKPAQRQASANVGGGAVDAPPPRRRATTLDSEAARREALEVAEARARAARVRDYQQGLEDRSELAVLAQQLAPMMDRVGRVLTDLAPHVEHLSRSPAFVSKHTVTTAHARNSTGGGRLGGGEAAPLASSALSTATAAAGAANTALAAVSEGERSLQEMITRLRDQVSRVRADTARLTDDVARLRSEVRQETMSGGGGGEAGQWGGTPSLQPLASGVAVTLVVARGVDATPPPAAVDEPLTFASPPIAAPVAAPATTTSPAPGQVRHAPAHVGGGARPSHRTLTGRGHAQRASTFHAYEYGLRLYAWTGRGGGAPPPQPTGLLGAVLGLPPPHLGGSSTAASSATEGAPLRPPPSTYTPFLLHSHPYAYARYIACPALWDASNAGYTALTRPPVTGTPLDADVLAVRQPGYAMRAGDGSLSLLHRSGRPPQPMPIVVPIPMLGVSTRGGGGRGGGADVSLAVDRSALVSTTSMALEALPLASLMALAASVEALGGGEGSGGRGSRPTSAASASALLALGDLSPEQLAHVYRLMLMEEYLAGTEGGGGEEGGPNARHHRRGEARLDLDRFVDTQSVDGSSEADDALEGEEDTGS